MSTLDRISPSLSTLPTELIYRILNILDNQTILFSFGYLCKRFNSITYTYNQYKFNFKSISKSYFNCLCNRIQSENIVSLILSNDNQTPDQIKYFLRNFSMEKFIRLRSLTLIQIDENDFHQIFSTEFHFHSLSFTFRTYYFQNSHTLSLISSIISQPNLQYLDFSLSLSKIDGLSWPKQCFIQTLILTNRLNFKQFSTILSYSLQLKKFILQDCYIGESDYDYSSNSSYPQLISLTFDDSELDINQCEFVLSLLPSLEYLQIIGGTDLSDGFRWEEFIKKKLIYLKKFQFAFCGNTHIQYDNINQIQTLIKSFQTTFWIDIKQWFVVCYYFKTTWNYSLYSLPICKPNVRLYPYKDKISCTNYMNFNIDQTMTDNVNEMQLNLTNLMTINDDEQIPTIYPFFRKLTKLELCVTNEWPNGSVEYLSTFIDLSTIVELSISMNFYSETLSNTLEKLSLFFKQIPQLRSLMIDSTSINAENICLIVPNSVKHLQIIVKNIDDMKIIIEQLRYLSSVTFDIFNAVKNLSTEFLPWLMEKRNRSTCRIDDNIVSIWFDKMTTQIN